MKNKEMFRDGRIINSEIKLPLIDRVRLICGMKIFIQTEVSSQWRMGTTEAKNVFMIQRVASEARVKITRLLARFSNNESNFIKTLFCKHDYIFLSRITAEGSVGSNWSGSTLITRYCSKCKKTIETYETN